VHDSGFRRVWRLGDATTPLLDTAVLRLRQVRGGVVWGRRGASHPSPGPPAAGRPLGRLTLPAGPPYSRATRTGPCSRPPGQGRPPQEQQRD